MVELYTLPQCPICKMIKTKLEAKMIPYIEHSLEEYIEELKTDRAPVMKIVENDATQYLYTPTEMNTWIKEWRNHEH